MYKIDFLYKNRRPPHLSHRVGGKEGAQAQGGESGALSPGPQAHNQKKFIKNLFRKILTLLLIMI